MDGSKLKIKASTIMEVVVAMVIIVIVFGIAMMIYTNVLRFSLSSKKINAQAMLQEIMFKAEENPENSNQSITSGDFRIEQEIKSYQENSKLSDIHLTAYDQNGQKVTELEKVIINSNE